MQSSPTKNGHREFAIAHSAHPAPVRLIGVDPFSRGFAYVVFEDWHLIDWRTVVADGPHRNERCVERLGELLRRYRPERLIMEDPAGSRRHSRIRELLDDFRSEAEGRGVAVRVVRWSSVARFWSDGQAPTKHDIANALAEYYPELLPRLPKARRPWDSQDPSLSIFCAAALVLTYFWLRVARPRKKPNTA